MNKRSFAMRPGDPEGWIKATDGQRGREPNAPAYTARMTIDVTPELRGRIKVAAFHRGQTVADMLRDLFAREFPADGEAR